jgi:S-methylmethionine-dependent homocysteine/selenocysteine methylase
MGGVSHTGAARDGRLPNALDFRILDTVQTPAAQRFGARLESGLPIVLDGSVRGALTRAGVDLTQSLGTAAVLSGQTHVLSTIHQRYCAAGVHVLRTNTAGTTPNALARAGYGYRAAKLSSLAVDLASEAVEASGRMVCVAGVLPAMEGSDERLRGEQVAHAQRLVAAGADLLFIDAVHTLREAVAAVAAAAQTELPVLVGLRVGETGTLADGEALELVVQALAGAGARGFLAMPADPAGEVRATAELATLGRPWGVIYGGTRELSPSEYAERALELVQEGATLLGGEDVASPEHVRALVAQVPGADRELKRPSVNPSASLPRAHG